MCFLGVGVAPSGVRPAESTIQRHHSTIYAVLYALLCLAKGAYTLTRDCFPACRLKDQEAELLMGIFEELWGDQKREEYDRRTKSMAETAKTMSAFIGRY